MNFDLEFVKQAFGALGNALTVLKQAKDLLPEGGKKVEVAKAIENAETELKNAEGKIRGRLWDMNCAETIFHQKLCALIMIKIGNAQSVKTRKTQESMFDLS